MITSQVFVRVLAALEKTTTTIHKKKHLIWLCTCNKKLLCILPDMEQLTAGGTLLNKVTASHNSSMNQWYLEEEGFFHLNYWKNILPHEVIHIHQLQRHLYFENIVSSQFEVLSSQWIESKSYTPNNQSATIKENLKLRTRWRNLLQKVCKETWRHISDLIRRMLGTNEHLIL